MAQKLKKLFGFGEDPVSEDKKLWGLAPNVNVPREMAIKGHDILYVDRSHEIKGSIYFEDEFEQINCEKLAFGYVWLLTCNDPHYVHVAMDMLPALCALEKKVGPRTQKGQKLKIHIEAMRKVMRTNHAYRAKLEGQSAEESGGGQGRSHGGKGKFEDCVEDQSRKRYRRDAGATPAADTSGADVSDGGAGAAAARADALDNGRGEAGAEGRGDPDASFAGLHRVGGRADPFADWRVGAAAAGRPDQAAASRDGAAVPGRDEPPADASATTAGQAEPAAAAAGRTDGNDGASSSAESEQAAKIVRLRAMADFLMEQKKGTRASAEAAARDAEESIGRKSVAADKAYAAEIAAAIAKEYLEAPDAESQSLCFSAQAAVLADRKVCDKLEEVLVELAEAQARAVASPQ